METNMLLVAIRIAIILVYVGVVGVVISLLKGKAESEQDASKGFGAYMVLGVATVAMASAEFASTNKDIISEEVQAKIVSVIEGIFSDARRFAGALLGLVALICLIGCIICVANGYAKALSIWGTGLATSLVLVLVINMASSLITWAASVDSGSNTTASITVDENSGK